jgi:hypothetical protein
MKATNDDTFPVINARASLAKFFEGTLNRDLIFIKLSTNGLIVKNSPLPSVLGIAAAKYELRLRRQITLVSQYERYYFPKEAYNPKAILVNSLDEPTIISKRYGYGYPEHFDEDTFPLIEYCKGNHLFIGHSIDQFEAKFLPWLHDPGNRIFDLMKENTDILRLEHEYGCCDGWKWPNIRELLDYYCIPGPNEGLISGMQYVRLLASIFQEMLSRSELRRIVISS